MSTPDPNMRLSNAEREALIAKLHAATEEGRLDLVEFDDRSREVYAAKTYGEVERLLADLPHDIGQVVVPGAPAPDPRRSEPAAPDLRLAPSFSSVKRKGTWTAPRKIAVEGSFSSVKLDFTSAVIIGDEVEIDIDTNFSSLELILPAGAYAEADADLAMSSITNLCEYKGANGRRFKIRGRLRMGSLKIRYQRRFLWWRW